MRHRRCWNRATKRQDHFNFAYSAVISLVREVGPVWRLSNRLSLPLQARRPVRHQREV